MNPYHFLAVEAQDYADSSARRARHWYGVGDYEYVLMQQERAAFWHACALEFLREGNERE